MQYLSNVETKLPNFIELAKDETLLETPKYKIFKQEPYIALKAFMLYILLAFFFIWILDDGKIDLHLAILLPIVGIPFSLTKVFTHSLFEMFPFWKTHFTTNMNLYLQGDVEYIERRQQKFEKHIANKIYNDMKEVFERQGTLFLQGLLIEDQSSKKELKEKIEKYDAVLEKIDDLIGVCQETIIDDDSGFYSEEINELQQQRQHIFDLKEKALDILAVIERGEKIRSVYAIREEARFQTEKRIHDYWRMT